MASVLASLERLLQAETRAPPSTGETAEHMAFVKEHQCYTLQ
jgi:hypothetical protein